jgi:fucose permease
MYILVGLGSGVQNAAWNVWIGNMANSNEVLGFFHGFYGVGATISPLVATSLISKAGWPWYSFYYLMVFTFRSPTPFPATHPSWKEPTQNERLT